MIELKLFLRSLLFLVIISFLFPILKIGSTTSVKLDWIFINLFLTFFILFCFNDLVKNKLYLNYFKLFVFIALFTLVSNYVSGFYYLQGGNYRLPTTILQILNRIVVFVFFSYCIIKGWVSFHKIKIVINIVFLLGLVFGFFQFFDFLGAKEIALKYYLEEGSVQELNFSSYSRIIGVSPAIITWGGCCVMIFHYFYFIVAHKIIKYLGVFLAIFNVLAAASRAAIISLVVSYFLILMIKVVLVDKKIGSFFKIILTAFVLLLLSYQMLKVYVPEQVEFLEKRFDKSGDAMTNEGRGEQIQYFLNMLQQDYFGLIFGVGDSVVAEYGYLEVDYAYVLVSFGIVGFILHYLLLYFLLREAYFLRKYDSNSFLFVFGSTIGYLIFSFGFYFFYELYMGMPFWWLNGLIIGYLWRLKTEKDGSKKNKSLGIN